MKEKKTHIKFPKLNLDHLYLKVYTDTSFNNLPNGGSQGGQIVFLCDESNNSCPCHGTQQELKELSDRPWQLKFCETALYLSDVVRSNSMFGEDSCPDVISINDNKPLFDAVHSTKRTLGRRLRLDISVVREMCEREEACLQ